jgi:hypothetical protein
MRKVGIWIDRRRAVVVEIENGAENVRTMESNVEPPGPPASGSRPSTPRGPRGFLVKEHGREEHYMHQLANFYRNVASQIGRPDRLLVMGPANAKKEFAEIAQTLHDLSGVPMAIEAADKMTDPQIAAKVRDYTLE